ncbi:MAG: serine protease [Clostridia bacterium]|nr:serine protease [Clostridia bacterium]
MKLKLKSFFNFIVLFVLIIPVMIIFSACGSDYSAKNLAVELGYTSVEEMVEGLKGKDGEKGADGADGRDGKDAVNAYELYETAVANGEFSGTFIEFLKEFNVVADDGNAIASKAILSVVRINNGAKDIGTGVIYSIDKDEGNALIITNFHVVSSGNTTSKGMSFKIYLYGESSGITATVVGAVKTYDLAVLKVSESEVIKQSHARAIDFAESYHVGDKVYALGNANGNGISVTQGVISVESEKNTMKFSTTSQYKIRMLRHDAYITHGNSGGALVNTDGDLVGITNGGIENTDMNNAYPVDLVQKVVNAILRYCENTESTNIKVVNLGIEESTVSTTIEEVDGVLNVVYTQKIEALSGTAADAGVLQVGDILKRIEIGPKVFEITKNYSLEESLLLAKVGDEIKIVTNQGGSEVVWTITLEDSNFKSII